MEYQPSFRTIHQPLDAASTVYWMTHAGGGINTLSHRMRTVGAELPIRVRSPLMPAREDQADDHFEGDLDSFARLLGDQIVSDRAKETDPFVLIGHSFGSMLAYRIACHLISLDVIPDRLVVMSYPAPDVLSQDHRPHQLSDEELIRQVDELFGGIPEDIRDDVEAQKFFVPGLRFDLELLERYEHQEETPPIPVPITAICGTDDRAVDMAAMQRWSRMTQSDFRLRAMPGDHFFPLARMPEIFKVAFPSGM